MSLEAITWALRQEMKPAVRKLIFIKLCDNADDATGLCFPSLANIASVAGCDVRTVQRHLRELEASGLVKIVEKGGTSRKIRRANTYRVTMGWSKYGAAECQGTPGTMSPTPPAECQGTPGSLPDQPLIEPFSKEPVGKASRQKPRLTPRELMEIARLWNAMASEAGLPSVDLELWESSLSISRLRKLSEKSATLRNLELYSALFEAISLDDGLCGRRPPKPGHKNSWRCTLHWLTERDNLQKTIEQLRAESS